MSAQKAWSPNQLLTLPRYVSKNVVPWPMLLIQTRPLTGVPLAPS